MQIDLTNGAARLTRTDAWLLVLAAQNHLLFREGEWRWHIDPQVDATILHGCVAITTRAMNKIRVEVARPCGHEGNAA
jgi:hypothetical protein